MPLRATPIARLVLLLPLILAGGCVTRRVIHVFEPPPGVTAAEAPRLAENMRVFAAAWGEIKGKYYDPQFNGVDWDAAYREFAPRVARAADEAALYALLNEMLGRLKDDHTGVMIPRQAEIYESRRFTGIGVQVDGRDRQHVVAHVITGGPAEKAGIEPGWKVITRDGLPFEEALGIPLKAGQVSPWVFEDLSGRRVQLSLAAAVVKTTHREARLLAGGLAYVRFDGFDLDSIGWLRARLAEYREAPGVILDLRQNPGGVVASALYALGHFVDNAEIVVVSIGRGEGRSRWTPLGKASARFPGKVAVLVSGNSSSGSEVLAAVLQERGRGVIVGQKTAGSVLAATVVPLPDGGLLEYSVSDLLTARGVRLEGVGIIPDIVVPPTSLEDRRARRDPALDRAVEALSR